MLTILIFVIHFEPNIILLLSISATVVEYQFGLYSQTDSQFSLIQWYHTLLTKLREQERNWNILRFFAEPYLCGKTSYRKFKRSIFKLQDFSFESWNKNSAYAIWKWRKKIFPILFFFLWLRGLGKIFVDYGLESLNIMYSTVENHNSPKYGINVKKNSEETLIHLTYKV